MNEAIIVALLVIALVVTGALAVTLPWTTLVFAGAALIALGVVLGIPTGVLYHVALYQRLSPRGQLPARWYWSPVRYHALLRDEERASVLLWFYFGAAGFTLIVIGGLAIGLGLAFSG